MHRENNTSSDNTVLRIFTNESFQSDDVRVAAGVIKSSAEYLRLFTEEAIALAIRQKEETGETVDSRDLDRVKEELRDGF
ncbi:hypothetical protein LXG23DRAFT_53377 [Yarrowia lipolytica]|nr:hypothetical protein LXG23DRAFT_53377 [Yarrowia lipolytica]